MGQPLDRAPVRPYKARSRIADVTEGIFDQAAGECCFRLRAPRLRRRSIS